MTHSLQRKSKFRFITLQPARTCKYYPQSKQFE